MAIAIARKTQRARPWTKVGPPTSPGSSDATVAALAVAWQMKNQISPNPTAKIGQDTNVPMVKVCQGTLIGVGDSGSVPRTILLIAHARNAPVTNASRWTPKGALVSR